MLFIIKTKLIKKFNKDNSLPISSRPRVGDESPVRHMTSCEGGGDSFCPSGDTRDPCDHQTIVRRLSVKIEQLAKNNWWRGVGEEQPGLVTPAPN